MTNTQMAYKLPAELRDHFLVQYILGKLVNQVTGCELVKDSSVDEMDEYPFFTFRWIDPGEETTADWLGPHRQYTCSMQIDAHASSDLQAMDLAQRLYEALHERPYRRFFSQACIMPSTIGNAGNRTVLRGINYDNDYGFEVEDYTIESIRAKESVIGSNSDGAISVSKNNKEEI